MNDPPELPTPPRLPRLESVPSVNTGKVLEASVESALRAAGYRVSVEELLSYKKVDLLARQLRWGRDWVTAVECKDYASALGLDDVAHIWSEYAPLYENGSVDEVLVVSSNGFSAAAMGFIRERRGLVGRTLAALLDSIIDFRQYLLSLVEAYEFSADGVKSYYQRPLTVDGDDLESVVLDWAHSVEGHAAPPSDRPIAILGAYGIGKSSFASHLAAGLAESALADTRQRIPILIRLGEIGGEQSLDGLLGKHFTARHGVAGYSFPAFMLLNRRGRFVIILDGFDEMKQLLTWREFRYNLRELNRLHDGLSKLVLLGRPTAFETDHEHDLALHGGRGVATSTEPGWPDYVELEVALLENEAMKAFLLQYMTYRKSAMATDTASFTKLWEQVRSKHLRDIARRPVQLRMLAEVLPQYTGNVADLTVTRLYELFIAHLIDEVVRREEDKQSRLAFSMRQRRDFLRGVAFWLWTSPDPVASTEDIPADLVQRCSPPGETLEAARRDLIVGSPLDRRLGERLRFPHRSFQEYLVAEELWLRLIAETIHLPAADEITNIEAASFLGLQMGRSEVGAVLRELRQLRGQLSWRIVTALLIGTDVTDQIASRFRDPKKAMKAERPAPWELLAVSVDEVFRQGDERVRREALVPMLDSAYKSESDDGRLTLLALFVSAMVMATPRMAPEMPALVLDILHTLVSRRGPVERFTERQVEQRKSLNPLLDTMVVGSSEGKRRIGVILSKSRLTLDKGKLALSGDPLQVRWVPEYSMAAAKRLVFSKNGVEIRGLRSMFAASLADYAFVREWITRSPLGRPALASDVRLVDFVNGEAQTIDRLSVAARSLANGWARAAELGLLDSGATIPTDDML